MKDVPRAEFLDRHAVPDDAFWIARWRATGCRIALDRLVRANSGRLRAMARGWSREAHRQDDLVSEGVLALIGCLGGYAPREGVPFFAYARPFVRAAMRRCFYRDAAIVAVPLHHVRALREGRGSELDRALVHAATCPERLDAPDAPELGADAETAEALLLRNEVDGARSRALDDALAVLSETERLLVERRRMDGACSLPDIARRIGVTPTQARKMEVRALARLRMQLILRGVTSASLGAGV